MQQNTFVVNGPQTIGIQPAGVSNPVVFLCSLQMCAYTENSHKFAKISSKTSARSLAEVCQWVLAHAPALTDCYSQIPKLIAPGKIQKPKLEDVIKMPKKSWEDYAAVLSKN